MQVWGSLVEWFWYHLNFWYRGTIRWRNGSRIRFWYHLNFWYRGTEIAKQLGINRFWYHLNFWYRGTIQKIIRRNLCFGIISIFGIEELCVDVLVNHVRFGIISIFGIEELSHK